MVVCYTRAMRWRPLLPYVLSSLGAALWATVVINWHGFIDPDAFYHAEMSRLILQGPLKAFPWLDLTVFGQHFADIHFLFHVVVAPFVLLFGDLQGLRIATVVLIGILGGAMYYAFDRLDLKPTWLWVTALFLTLPFIERISLGKATPMALIWFVLGLAFFWKRKDIALAIIACLFALTHNAWAFLAGSVGVLAFGRLLYARIVRGCSWWDALKECGVRGVIACMLGGLVGMLLHPNGLNVFLISWTTLITIGLVTPNGHIPMGQEWLPMQPGTFLVWYSAWLGLMILGLAGLAFAPRKGLGHAEGERVTSFGWLMAVLLAMSLKSVRVVEYLSPVLAIFCASIWQSVDVPKALEDLGLTGKKDGKERYLGYAVAGLIVGLFLQGAVGAWVAFHGSYYADDIFATTTRAIAARERPGDRVFNARWDEFPMLFHTDQNVRYVSGLDPVLFHVTTSTLATSYDDLTFGSATPTREQAWSVLHDQIGARFVFISTKQPKRLLSVISTDPRYTLIASSTDSQAYQIGP